MPERSRVRWAQLKVGVVAFTAIVIIAVLIFLLTSSKGIFTRNALLITYMANAAGITSGAPVTLNGITVGYLESVRLTNSTNPQRAVEFDMEVNEKYLVDIPVDSTVTIVSTSIVGAKYLNITRGTSREHVRPGDQLSGVGTQDVQELMATMAGLLQSFQDIVNRANNLLAGVEQGKGTIGKFVVDNELYNRFTAIEDAAEKLLNAARTGGGTLSKLIYDPSLYNDMQAPIQRIDAILADLQAGRGTAGKIMTDPALYDQATQIATELRALVADLNAGKGTAGQLLKNDQIAQRAGELLAKLNTTLDKIDAGQGTIGQLLVNQQLYESLNGATREFQDLAKDIRANPKKFLRIRLALF
jgi:phospholipid/cholesterol/gamma-HCH transport system substrate-binding protein